MFSRVSLYACVCVGGGGGGGLLDGPFLNPYTCTQTQYTCTHNTHTATARCKLEGRLKPALCEACCCRCAAGKPSLGEPLKWTWHLKPPHQYSVVALASSDKIKPCACGEATVVEGNLQRAPLTSVTCLWSQQIYRQSTILPQAV